MIVFEVALAVGVLRASVLVIPDTHHGRVEDAQMTICLMLTYAFMEAADAEGRS